MVVPLAAAGARIAATRGAARASVRKAPARRRAPYTSGRERNVAQQQLRAAIRHHRKQQQQEQQSITDGGTMRALRAVRISLMMAAFLFMFCALQFFFGMLQFLGAGAEYIGEQYLWGWGAALIPGQTIFAAAYIITFIIGFLLLLVGAIVYAFSGVTWWQKRGWVWFALFIALSAIPFLNAFPWFFVWMVTVVYAQKRVRS